MPARSRREGAHLLLAEEVLEEREDALARCRIGRDGEDDACSERPRRDAPDARPSLAVTKESGYISFVRDLISAEISGN